MYRKSRSLALSLVIVVIALLTAFFGQAVLAQSDDTRANEVEIVGRVTGFSGLTITIGGVSFDITQAELHGSVTVGSVVKIKVTMAADGTLAVREVEPVGANDNSNDNTADNANDNGNDNSDDNSNDNANTNANDNGNDNSDDFQDDEFRLTGTITEVGAGYIVVSGFRVDTTGARIEGQPAVGAVVKVELTIGTDSYIASRIEPASPGDDRALPAACVSTAPAGWTTYAIQFGDTLSGVAVGSGARLADLIATNCIASPNRIAVGTILFVPREPAPVSSGNDNGNINDNDDNGNNNNNDNGDDNGNNNNNDNGDDHGNNNSNDNGDDHGGSNDNDD